VRVKDFELSPEKHTLLLEKQAGQDNRLDDWIEGQVGALGSC